MTHNWKFILSMKKIEASHWSRGEMNRPVAASLAITPQPLPSARHGAKGIFLSAKQNLPT